MPRKRMIHPGFFASEQLAACPRDARITFAGIWVHADDKGRMKDNAALIKAAVWPLDDDITRADVAAHLVALAAQGLLCRYETDQPLLHVVKWAEHQKINHPTPSKLPPCPAHEGLREDSGSPPVGLPESSPASAHSSVQFSSGQCSSSTEAAAALALLKDACDQAGMLVRWDRLRPEQVETVVGLIDTHGIARLVKSAQAQHQATSPAAYASAWLSGWQQLPAPRPRLVKPKCSVHTYEDADSCRGCASDRKASA